MDLILKTQMFFKQKIKENSSNANLFSVLTSFKQLKASRIKTKNVYICKWKYPEK